MTEKIIIPDDLKARLKKLSEASGMLPKAIMERLREIIDTDEKIATMDKEEFKIRYAVALLLRQQVSTGRTTDFYIMPIIHTSYRTVNTDAKYVGDVVGLVRKIEQDEGKIVEGEVEYGAGTLWRDAAKQLDKLEVGKVYKGSFVAEKNAWGWSLGGNNVSFVEVSDVKFPTIEEFYKEEIEPMNVEIPLSDMDMHRSQHLTDISVFNATIIDGDIRERPDHSEYGFYDITDNSYIGGEEGVKGQRLFLDPRDVKIESGADVKVGVYIRLDNKERLIPSAHFIIPVGDYQKKTFTAKPVTQQQETVSAEELSPEGEDDFGEI